MKHVINLLLIVTLAGCSVSKSTKTIHPFDGDVIGCGNFIVYKLTEDNQGFVSVVVDVTSIDLEERQTYGIGKTDLVKVTRKQYQGAINATLCNDVMVRNKPKELLEEIASAGLVDLIVSEGERKKANNNEPYKATIVLRNVTFDSVSIDYLRLENVNVGWLPG